VFHPRTYVFAKYYEKENNWRLDTQWFDYNDTNMSDYVNKHYTHYCEITPPDFDKDEFTVNGESVSESLYNHIMWLSLNANNNVRKDVGSVFGEPFGIPDFQKSTDSTRKSAIQVEFEKFKPDENDPVVQVAKQAIKNMEARTLSEPSWEEKFRWETAREMKVAIMITPNARLANVDHCTLSERAVELADALIEQLKGEEFDDEA
jgi:hypothetical protein